MCSWTSENVQMDIVSVQRYGPRSHGRYVEQRLQTPMPLGTRRVTYENEGQMHILFESMIETVHSMLAIYCHAVLRGFSTEAGNQDLTTKYLGFKC